MLQRLSDSDATVLLIGETGTGKGALAEAMHRMSTRANGPFVVVDCGAIPGNLIESELFGHEKGAFTGADRKREGAFSLASGGTLFLDEVGELDIDLQPKLLRALESREIRPVGSNQSEKVDVRIVSATNRDLREEVNRGSFRSDLYFRLNVMRIELPPLRERREDIPMLVESFYRKLVEDDTASPPAELLSRMLRGEWPGNVRELRAAVERAVVLGDLESTEPLRSSANAEFDYTTSYREAKEAAIGRWEERYIPELVERYDGNLSRAARAVSMDRNHLRKLLRRYRDE
jgi:DNA-binding NtrC family response regulator